MTAPRPDLLLIIASGLGRWLAPYGYPVPAPHLARLAVRAHLFRQAFATAPVGDPSQASIVTGTFPTAHGMLGPAHRGFRPRYPERHFARWCANLGYQTCRVATARPEDALPFEGSHMAELRRSTDLDSGLCAAELLAQPSAPPRYIEVKLRGGCRPFPEMPGTPANMPPPPIPDTPETRADMAGFIGAVARLDAAVGTILDAADTAANPDGVFIVFTTDHGPAFPLMKGTLRDEGLRSALLLALPRKHASAALHDAMVSHLDIFPTLCAFLDEPAPPWIQGLSLLPILQGTATTLHDRAFAQMDFLACPDPARSVRSAQFKFIRYFSEDSCLALANMDDSPSKTAALPTVLRGWHRPREQLFDLTTDPREFRNLAALPDFQDIRQLLGNDLEQWMRDQGDPLCAGEHPAPPGAHLVPRSWESASASTSP